MLKGGTQGKFKEVPFTFTPQARVSFLNLCKAFTTAPLLLHFDPLLPICKGVNLVAYTNSSKVDLVGFSA